MQNCASHRLTDKKWFDFDISNPYQTKAFLILAAKELEKKSYEHTFQIISPLDRFYYIIFFSHYHVPGFSITRLTQNMGTFKINVRVILKFCSEIRSKFS